MNNVQKNFRFTIVVLSTMLLAIWAVLALSTEPTEPAEPSADDSTVDARAVSTEEPPPVIVNKNVYCTPPRVELQVARKTAIVEKAEEETPPQESEAKRQSLMMPIPPRIIIQDEEEENLGIPTP